MPGCQPPRPGFNGQHFHHRSRYRPLSLFYFFIIFHVNEFRKGKRSTSKEDPPSPHPPSMEKKKEKKKLNSKYLIKNNLIKNGTYSTHSEKIKKIFLHTRQTYARIYAIYRLYIHTHTLRYIYIYKIRGLIVVTERESSLCIQRNMRLVCWRLPCWILGIIRSDDVADVSFDEASGFVIRSISFLARLSFHILHKSLHSLHFSIRLPIDASAISFL